MRLLITSYLRLRVIGFLLGLAFFAPISLQAQRQIQIQSSRELAAPRYIPSHDFDTQNIKLDLQFDWEREQALGTETITLAPLLTNLRQVELDAANMTFNSVKLSSGAPLKFETDESQEKLRITLDLLVPLLRSSKRLHYNRNHRDSRKAINGDLQWQALNHERKQGQHAHL